MSASRSCVVLLSGGLDSLLALRLMTIQGIEVTALHGVNCFHGTKSIEEKKEKLSQAALRLGAREIVFPDMTEEVIRITKHPQHGYGRHLNACIDCRLCTIAEGFRLMERLNADFIVTGEVLGQRPMSQRRDALSLADRMAEEMGYGGRLVRPLSALLLPPTIPQQNGWLDHKYLFDIKGRSRDRQMALAQEISLGEYPTPAGGCLLTTPEFGKRMAVMVRYTPHWNANDAELLKVGRHYQTTPTVHIIASRCEEENNRLTTLALESDILFINDEQNGALVLVRGAADPEQEQLAAGLAVWYSKMRTADSARVRRWNMLDGKPVNEQMRSAKPIDPDIVRALEQELTGGNSLALMRASARR